MALFLIFYFSISLFVLFAMTAADEACGLETEEEVWTNIWGALIWPILLVILAGFTLGYFLKKEDM